MNQYDFTLKFRLKNPEESAEKYARVLAENGCDDALVGIGKLGRVSLNFTREATSAFAAITSAIKDVKKSIPGVLLVEATPDFVGITDIADIYGSSRQYIRQVVFNQAVSFPEPVHEGNPSLWHLADVLNWITTHEPKRLDRELLEISQLNMQINLYRSFLKSSNTTMSNLRFDVDVPDKAMEWDHFFRSAFGYATKVTPHG
ncbi:MAG: DNA-binding protein [Xanthomonadales bacterium]|nr:DNA-binding protein [Xanthomonadales bacterium]